MSSNKKIFFGVMGAPYENELTTSLLRMVDESLRQENNVTVWTCGGATTLTMQSPGETKPFNFLDLSDDKRERQYPSTAAMIKELLGSSNGKLKWCVCRHCMEERGAELQIDEVKIQSPFKYNSYFQNSEVSLILGVK